MNENKGRKLRQLIPLVAMIVLFIAIMTYVSTSSANRVNGKKVTYYDIVDIFTHGQVADYKLNIGNGNLTYHLRGDETTVYKYTVPSVNLFYQDVHEFIVKYNALSEKDQIKYDYVSGSGSSWLLSMLPSAAMILVMVALFYFMMKRMGQGLMGDVGHTMSFGKARIHNANNSKKTTFADVAGADEEKEELSELVDFLKNPQKYNELGARIPKGVLLVGPPGTGKTLLARAVAGEAGVPFLSISGSDFLEMYVGVGASRVRDLFDQAKKNAPAIIFIDEIDAVGRHRGAGMGGGHDEREQTLNQMLVEMDGFVNNEGVIVIAATNRPDILDPALLRPGRFDRQVTVGYPDIKGREEILKVHARNKSFAPDVVLSEVAKATVGFTGADLENLLNEAALLSARRGIKAITKAEIDEATIKVVVGTEKKSHKISDEEKNLTAYHEAGHAVSSYFLGGQDPVHQVSIIPRGMAGGFTMHLPEKDRQYHSKLRMEQELVTLLGGRVAEAIILGDISTGASNDIERASEIARKMVTKYGMSTTLGPITFGSGNDEVFLGKDYSTIRNYSEDTAKQIDNEVNRIITEAYKRCEDILREHIDKLHVLAKYLFENEKIDGEMFEKLMKDEMI